MRRVDGTSTTTSTATSKAVEGYSRERIERLFAWRANGANLTCSPTPLDQPDESTWPLFNRSAVRRWAVRCGKTCRKDFHQRRCSEPFRAPPVPSKPPCAPLPPGSGAALVVKPSGKFTAAHPLDRAGGGRVSENEPTASVRFRHVEDNRKRNRDACRPSVRDPRVMGSAVASG